MPRASIEFMNERRDYHRANGTGGKSHAPIARKIPSAEHKERRLLLQALALIEASPLNVDRQEVVAIAHFCRLNNDELREFIEGQMDRLRAIAGWMDGEIYDCE